MEEYSSQFGGGGGGGGVAASSASAANTFGGGGGMNEGLIAMIGIALVAVFAIVLATRK